MNHGVIAVDTADWGWPKKSGTDARKKLSAQIDSVVQKGLPDRLRQSLSEEHHLSGEAVAAVADMCLQIVWQRAGERAPNQIWLKAPAGLGPGSRRYATRELCDVLVTPVDEDDLFIWYESGLGAMQRARVLRTLEQAARQGGQFQLRELAALYNLTVNATKERLRPLREQGVRLPYHGRSHAQRKRERIGRLWFVVERVILGEDPKEICALCGISSRRLPEIVLWWARVCDRYEAGVSPIDIAAREGLSFAEVEEAVALDEAHPKARANLAPKPYPYVSTWPLRSHTLGGSASVVERNLSEYLLRQHGWSARRIGAIVAQLREATELYAVSRESDEILYEAVAEEEPLGRPLRDCEIDTTKLRMATEEEGVGGDRPARITDVKRTKLQRYTEAAADQSAFLTNADLCYLLGVHTDVVSRLLREPWASEVPTRQKAWERRATWLARLIEIAERALHGTPIEESCELAGLPVDETSKEIDHLVQIANDIETGRALSDIMLDREAARWLVDRLTQHPSLTLLSRLARNNRPKSLF